MMENGRFTSPYTPNTDDDRQRMLDAIGVRSFDDLVADIPAEHRNPPIDLPPPTSELELRREIGAMAEQNAVPGDYACFLGAGSYRHFIPAIVRSVATRSEFMTAYTPYQPEVSQGTLQAHYEFQSLVCQLTGMEVANAGMYDGATSMAEAALMAARVTKRDRVAVLDTVSPAYRQVLETFLDSQGDRDRHLLPRLSTGRRRNGLPAGPAAQLLRLTSRTWKRWRRRHTPRAPCWS